MRINPVKISFHSTILILCLVPIVASALNLKRSVVTALARAEETKVAASQVRQSQIQLNEARTENSPDVTLAAKTGPQLSNNDLTGSENYLYFQSNGAITKPLLDGEGTRFKIEANQLNLLATQYQSRSVLELTAMDVINSYLQVVYRQEIVRVHSSNIAEFRQVEEITQARKNNGVATEADVLLVQARVVSTQAQLNRARLDLAKSQNQYNVLVGPIENDMIIPFVIDDIFFENFELMAEKMRGQNSSLQRSKYQRRVTLADLNVIRSAGSPVISASVEYDYSNSFGGGSGQNLILGAYVNLNYSYNTGGALNLAQSRQQERIKELALLRELLIRDLEIDLQQEYSSYQSYKKVLRALEKELHANRGVLVAQKEQQKIGKVKLLDILNSQDRVNNTQIRLLQARQENQLIRYRLLSLMGELLPFFKN